MGFVNLNARLKRGNYLYNIQQVPLQKVNIPSSPFPNLSFSQNNREPYYLWNNNHKTNIANNVTKIAQVHHMATVCLGLFYHKNDTTKYICYAETIPSRSVSKTWWSQIKENWLELFARLNWIHANVTRPSNASCVIQI